MAVKCFALWDAILQFGALTLQSHRSFGHRYADGPMVELVSDRTFFIDRCVGRVAGLARLVILGSGLDMRAYRLACLPEHCHVYEVCRQAGVCVTGNCTRWRITAPRLMLLLLLLFHPKG
jgi:hypothetical protein